MLTILNSMQFTGVEMRNYVRILLHMGLLLFLLTLALHEGAPRSWAGANDGQKYLDHSEVEFALSQAQQGDMTALRRAQEALDAQLVLLDPQPHFDKTIYYLAEDMRIYALGYQFLKAPQYLAAAEKIAQYFTHFLRSPQGAFYTSQIEHRIYARENGWAISALASLYMASGQSVYLEQAQRAAEWISKNRSVAGGGFRHDNHDPAGPYLSDTLAMGRAFLALYQATADRDYLIKAEQAAQFINQHFKNTNGKPGFITRVPADSDENATLARFANLLFQYTGDKTYKTMAQSAMQYLANPSIAKQEITQDPLHLTIVGFKNDAQAKTLYLNALAYPATYKRIEWWDKEEGDLPNPDVQYPQLKKAAAFVCTNQRCSLPVFNPDDLTGLINRLSHHPPTTMKTAVIIDPETAQEKVTQLLVNNNWGLILIGFLSLGVLLAFTPCVLPMIPILASIIVGQGKKITTRRAFGLSLTYVLAMAVTYALAGVIAGLAGNYVQAYLQNPWVITGFSLIFVCLALSLLGLYELRLPAGLHHRFATFSHQQTKGTYTGVAIMGCLATLIASPCVTAPLVGVLSYIGQSGNAVLGGLALFCLGLGMGLPLLLVGTLGGSILPKTGTWLRAVNVFFGLMLLGVAIWFMERIVPDYISMLLWAVLALITSVYMGVFDKMPTKPLGKLLKALSLLVLLYGLALALGAFMGNNNVLQPLQINGNNTVTSKPVQWEVMGNLATLQSRLKEPSNKPIIVDFYADWCVSCKHMDKYVFTDPQVKKLLEQFTLLRVDVTNSNEADMAITKHYQVIAPPTLLFFNQAGQQLKTRIDGEQNTQELMNTLQRILLDKK